MGEPLFVLKRRFLVLPKKQKSPHSRNVQSLGLRCGACVCVLVRQTGNSTVAVGASSNGCLSFYVALKLTANRFAHGLSAPICEICT